MLWDITPGTIKKIRWKKNLKKYSHIYEVKTSLKNKLWNLNVTFFSRKNTAIFKILLSNMTGKQLLL